MGWYLTGLLLIPYVFVGTETGNMIAAVMASIALLLQNVTFKKRSLRVTAFLAWTIMVGIFMGRMGMVVGNLPLWISVGIGILMWESLSLDEFHRISTCFKRIYVDIIAIIASLNIVLYLWFAMGMKGLVGYENTFALQLSLALLISTDDLRSTKTMMQSVKGVWSMIRMVVFVVALLMTGAKFTWGLLTATILLRFIMARVGSVERWNGHIVGYGAIILPLLTLIGMAMLTVFPSFATGAGTLLERIMVIRDIVTHWARHPLSFVIGEGLGSFQKMQYGLQSVFYDIRHIHNGLMTVLFETGVVGLCLLLYAFRGLQVQKRDAGLYLGFMVAHMLFEFDLSFAWFLFGLIVLMCTPSGNQDKNSMTGRQYKGLNAVYVGIPMLIVTTTLLVPMLMIHVGDLLKDVNPNVSASFYERARLLAPWSDAPLNAEFDLMVLAISQDGDGNKGYANRAMEIVERLIVDAENRGVPEGRLHLNRAYLRGLTGDVEGAAADYESAIILMPLNPNGYEGYGRFIDRLPMDDPSMVRLADISRKRMMELKSDAFKLLDPIASFLPGQIS